MNVVFSVRVVIASFISIFFLVLPRVLVYFGLNHPWITTLISPWMTFGLIIIAGIVVTWKFLRNPIYFPFVISGIVIVAFGLTFYFCQLELPW